MSKNPCAGGKSNLSTHIYSTDGDYPWWRAWTLISICQQLHSVWITLWSAKHMSSFGFFSSFAFSSSSLLSSSFLSLFSRFSSFFSFFRRSFSCSQEKVSLTPLQRVEAIKKHKLWPKWHILYSTHTYYVPPLQTAALHMKLLKERNHEKTTAEHRSKNDQNHGDVSRSGVTHLCFLTGLHSLHEHHVLPASFPLLAEHRHRVSILFTVPTN